MATTINSFVNYLPLDATAYLKSCNEATKAVKRFTKLVEQKRKIATKRKPE